MLKFTQGNLLEADAEALVNTVNTAGVMGKGIALMFKEAYPENFRLYAAACRRNDISAGSLFVTERRTLIGPKWIVNFATKDHWRYPSRKEWIESGLEQLKSFIVENGVKSIAIPPLGAGNGGLDWREVRSLIERTLGPLEGVNILVYELTRQYQNVAKRDGVEKLTPARALVAEAVRRYCIIGMECTLLEVQKLAYFLESVIESQGLENPLKLEFAANKFGPFSPALTHLLDSLDGSYLHCGRRLADAGPMDTIWFDESKREKMAAYLGTEAKSYVLRSRFGGSDRNYRWLRVTIVDGAVVHGRLDGEKNGYPAVGGCHTGGTQGLARGRRCRIEEAEAVQRPHDRAGHRTSEFRTSLVDIEA